MAPRRPRNLIEEESYSLCVERLGYSQRILDSALLVLTTSIANNAEAFAYIPNQKPIRLAKTKVVIRDLEIYPALRLRFYIGRDDQVHLWHLELAPADDVDIFDN
jgi:hypothetical protein